MMTIRDLQFLVAIADWKSARLAASTFGVEQSTLSRRVRAIEESLGVSLFERHSGGMRTTTAGEEFIGSIRNGLGFIEQAISSASMAGVGRAGELHIGAWAISDGPLRHLITEFGRENRGITIRIFDSNARTLFSLILERKLDLIMAAGNDIPPSFDSLVLGQQRLYVALQAGMCVANNVTWSALANVWCISPSQDEGEKLQSYISRYGGPKLRILVQECSRDTRLSLVAAGIGFLPLLEYSVRTPVAGVEYAPIADPEIVVPLRLCWLPNKDNPALRRFVSLARRIVATRDWQSQLRNTAA